MTRMNRVTASSAPTAFDLDSPQPAAARPMLTPRERDVVRGIIAGRTNKEMALDLGVKEQRVKNLLWTVFDKCQVRNRLELALFALEHHLAD